MPSSVSRKTSHFPIYIENHGMDMITIQVGRDEQSQSFAIHKGLLVEASPYFSNALLGEFKEAQQNTIELKDNDPIAFKVFYQYVYSGNVHGADFYTKGAIPDDVLWLRAFKLAHSTMAHDLLLIIYDRLRAEFSNATRTLPTLQFVAELCDQDEPQLELEEYVAAHAAYWILHDCGDWTAWVSVMEGVPDFALAVVRQIVKRKSSTHRGAECHPSDDPLFDKHTLFLAPVLGGSLNRKERHLKGEKAKLGKEIAARGVQKKSS